MQVSRLLSHGTQAMELGLPEEFEHWHDYQALEQLPIEKRGGKSNAQSWLHNKSVQDRTRAWLTSQPTGKVTP
jgi:hypothetical protein